MMIVETQCGHTHELPSWPADSTLICLHHGKQPITAIECREWKVTCFSCIYARWCGQDRSAAIALQGKHKHPAVVDYLMVDANKARVKRFYRGRIALRINSDKERVKLKNAIRAQTEYLPELLLEVDEPPF